MTPAQARIAIAEAKPTKPRKFRNTPVEVDGVKYHSKAEARRGADLALLQRAGKISGLRGQTPFTLEVKGQKIATYKADFTYFEGGSLVVEDVKSATTAKERAFILIRKLMRACHGIDVKVVS